MPRLGSAQHGNDQSAIGVSTARPTLTRPNAESGCRRSIERSISGWSGTVRHSAAITTGSGETPTSPRNSLKGGAIDRAERGDLWDPSLLAKRLRNRLPEWTGSSLSTWSSSHRQPAPGPTRSTVGHSPDIRFDHATIRSPNPRKGRCRPQAPSPTSEPAALPSPAVRVRSSTKAGHAATGGGAGDPGPSGPSGEAAREAVPDAGPADPSTSNVTNGAPTGTSSPSSPCSVVIRLRTATGSQPPLWRSRPRPTAD